MEVSGFVDSTDRVPQPACDADIVNAPGLPHIDYVGMTQEWLADFSEWRETHGPDTYDAIAQGNQPSRLRMSSPYSTIENLMVRSTNSIDDEQVRSLATRRGAVHGALKAAEAFYRRGNYITHRSELFDKLADQGADDFLPELYVRLAEVVNVIPETSLREQGFSKLCRAIGGFAFLAILERGAGSTGIADISDALRAGYDFGITYPLVDDLLHDSGYLKAATADEQHTDLDEVIAGMLTTGSTEGLIIPKNSITDELIGAFDDILKIFPFESNPELYRAVLVLHQAQIADGKKSEFTQPVEYEQDDFTPYIIKAAMTRIIPFMVAKGGAQNLGVGSIRKIIGLGLRTQLHDDLLDIESDRASGTHTPYSPYLNGEQVNGSLSPGELFIDALFYSMDKDFSEQHKRRATRVLLGTAAHAFASLDEATLGQLDMSPEYTQVIQRIVKRYPSAKVESGLQNRLDGLALNRSRLCKQLDVYMFDVQDRLSGQLGAFIDGADEKFQPLYRHALDSYAKRMRPALAYITADTFSVPREDLDAFALAAELLHSASLIFDDLPAQDNATLRRGQETLHTAFGEGEAQLAALSMIFDAQQLLAQIDTAHNLGGTLAEYINASLGQHGLCLGQLYDLESFGVSRELPQDVDALDEITHLKTGLAIEMSIVGSALIAGQPPEVIDTLKAYSYHTGLAFQIKDDLLDASDSAVIGKDANADVANEKPNYVEVLGNNEAQKKLDYHLAKAQETLAALSSMVSIRKYVEILDYIAGRDH
jgi:geranylgeranyl pyrophosphate synthase